MVCNSTQALLYDELGMSDFVLASFINNRPDNNGNLKRKADVFEGKNIKKKMFLSLKFNKFVILTHQAFVGALYIDQGLEAVGVFCSVCMFNKLQDIILYQFWNDPKSRLQQCCLSLRDVDESKPALPTYKLIEEKGPPNRKQYKVAVYFMRKRIGEGIGKSIHESEVEAAKNALKTKADMFPILNKYVPSKLNDSSKTVLENISESSKKMNQVVEKSKARTSKRKYNDESNTSASDKEIIIEKEKSEVEEGECVSSKINYSRKKNYQNKHSTIKYSSSTPDFGNKKRYNPQYNQQNRRYYQGYQEQDMMNYQGYYPPQPPPSQPYPPAASASSVPVPYQYPFNAPPPNYQPKQFHNSPPFKRQFLPKSQSANTFQYDNNNRKK